MSPNSQRFIDVLFTHALLIPKLRPEKLTNKKIPTNTVWFQSVWFWFEKIKSLLHSIILYWLLGYRLCLWYINITGDTDMFLHNQFCCLGTVMLSPNPLWAACNDGDTWIWTYLIVGLIESRSAWEFMLNAYNVNVINACNTLGQKRETSACLIASLLPIACNCLMEHLSRALWQVGKQIWVTQHKSRLSGRLRPHKGC